MLLLAVTLVAGAQDTDWAGVMARYREKTRAEVPCTAPSDGEIVVCERRDADRYRVPLQVVDRRDLVPLRTATLTEDVSRVPCGQGPTLARCGKVGVGVTRAFGPGAGSGETRVVTDKLREPAP